jgi:thiol-disulfide isomerase/thioredoxin
MNTAMPKMSQKQMMYCVVCLVAIIALGCIAFYCMKCMKSKTEQFESSPATLYFFKADWCGHCQRFKPVWDEFASENTHGTVIIKEMNVDDEECKPLMKKHNVRGFPHVVLVQEEHEDIVFTKNRTKEELVSFLNENS